MEEQSDKGKWTSGVKSWQIDKTFTGNGVHIDCKKKIVRMNPKNSWVRFETQDIIHVYTFEPIKRKHKHKFEIVKEEVETYFRCKCGETFAYPKG